MRPNLSSVPLTALAALALHLALAPVPARAEAAPGSSASPRFIEQPETGTMRGSKVIGVSVVGADHVRVGKIEDVLVDGTGRIQAVVIGVGGFLGVGEKYVAVPFDQLAWNFEDVSLTGGASSVATPANAPSEKAADKAGPGTMPGAQISPEVLGAVQNQHSGRVTEATGPVEPQKPDSKPATVLAGHDLIHAEVRLTKAQLNDAPAFQFEKAKR
ncbi:PRC-barrel domain-containing protein [Methylobacterium sp. R2-1]|uniref:PRC-barrel domain-containing protein n=1 Tax=Methylobacterium sp. R2-1 TaxID=2587064 RepID=UPI001620ADDB|nr:PRC-barrel domain-containing protein [Methylobacterium sp. R2-1]MBB2960133.1 sporulation protein YlmC with PRC-barrel domain [Methylobacterium sp. R2-1]